MLNAAVMRAATSFFSINVVLCLQLWLFTDLFISNNRKSAFRKTEKMLGLDIFPSTFIC